MTRGQLSDAPRAAGDYGKGLPPQVPYVYGAPRTGLARRTLELLRRELAAEDARSRPAKTPLPPRDEVFPGVLTQAPDPDPPPRKRPSRRKARPPMAPRKGNDHD